VEIWGVISRQHFGFHRKSQIQEAAEIVKMKFSWFSWQIRPNAKFLLTKRWQMEIQEA
jgi:hypothetical protein